MTAADKEFAKKIKFLSDSIDGLSKGVRTSQGKLLNLLIESLVTKLDTRDGVIISSTNNYVLLAELDEIFNTYQGLYGKELVKKLAVDLLAIREYNVRYFDKLGFERTKIERAMKSSEKIRKSLGLTPTGRLRKGSLLYDISELPAVRNELRDFVTSALLSEDSSLKEVQEGLKVRIEGAKGSTGRLERYYHQFAFDKFREIDEITNDSAAEKLGLHHFIYSGGLIKTSRKFCIKRNSRAFELEEFKKEAKQDKDLIDKKTKGSYLPSIELGRWGCRHSKKYITELLYNKFKDKGIAKEDT